MPEQRPASATDAGRTSTRWPGTGRTRPQRCHSDSAARYAELGGWTRTRLWGPTTAPGATPRAGTPETTMDWAALRLSHSQLSTGRWRNGTVRSTNTAAITGRPTVRARRPCAAGASEAPRAVAATAITARDLRAPVRGHRSSAGSPALAGRRAR